MAWRAKCSLAATYAHAINARPTRILPSVRFVERWVSHSGSTFRGMPHEHLLLAIAQGTPQLIALLNDVGLHELVVRCHDLLAFCGFRKMNDRSSALKLTLNRVYIE